MVGGCQALRCKRWKLSINLDLRQDSCNRLSCSKSLHTQQLRLAKDKSYSPYLGNTGENSSCREHFWQEQTKMGTFNLDVHERMCMVVMNLAGRDSASGPRFEQFKKAVESPPAYIYH